MKAALFQGAGRPFLIDTVADPVRNDGDVIVKVAHCGICGSDLHVTETDYLPRGTILGHEFSGTVVDAGPGGPSVGTRVTAFPSRICGKCDECKSGHFNLCTGAQLIGLGSPGAFAGYVSVPEKMIITLPDGVGFAEGALVEPLAVAYHAVELAESILGRNVLILGSGPIGAAVALFATYAGARTIVVSEFNQQRRERAAQLGATATIDPKTEDVGARFAALSGGAPDIVFECVGVPGTIAEALNLVRNRGRVVVAGACVSEDRFLPYVALTKEVSIRFSNAYVMHDFDVVIAALASKRINPQPLVTDIIGLDAMPATFEALRKPTTQCKVLVSMA